MKARSVRYFKNPRVRRFVFDKGLPAGEMDVQLAAKMFPLKALLLHKYRFDKAGYRKAMMKRYEDVYRPLRQSSTQSQTKRLQVEYYNN